jgi:hypothetical protein
MKQCGWVMMCRYTNTKVGEGSNIRSTTPRHIDRHLKGSLTDTHETWINFYNGSTNALVETRAKTATRKNTKTQFLYTCPHTNTHMTACVRPNVHTQTDAHPRMRTRPPLHTHTRTHTHAHTHARTYMCVHTQTSTCAHTCTLLHVR